VAAAIALLVVAGWWVVRAPFVTKAVAAAPDIAIELPPANAKADPGASATLAAAPTPAASVPDVSKDTERCGDEQRPEYGVTPRGPFQIQVQTKPGGLGYAAAQARIDAALRASADPFDHAVSDMLNVGDSRSPAAAVDAVAQDALASSDPRIYSLAMHACLDADARSGDLIGGPPPPQSCQSLNARQWTSIDPGNGVPWLLVYMNANSAEDAAAKADAMAHLVAATRFDDRPDIAAAAVLRKASPDPNDAAAANDLANRGLWMNHLTFIPRSDCQSALGHDVALTTQCEAVATTMFEHSDSIGLRNRGAWLTFYATGDSSRRDISHAEFERGTAHDKELAMTSQCSQERAQMKELLRVAQVGEVQARQESMKPPAKP
jgi:hypothetical protein